MLKEALGRDGVVEGLLSTDRRPTRSEVEVLAATGCTFLDRPMGTINMVRFEARDINSIVNLGLVEGVELLER
jgi:hypothetical protein